MEAETVALSHAAKEALWLRQLCPDLDVFGDLQLFHTLMRDPRYRLDLSKFERPPLWEGVGQWFRNFWGG